MMRQDLDKGEKLVEAILEESGMSVSSAQLVKSIFQKQQEILIALDDVVRNSRYQNQHIEKRLDDLLERVDPEEAAKHKRNI